MNLGDVLVKFKADTTNFQSGVGTVQQNMKQLGTSMQSTGKKMTVGLTLPLVLLGAGILKVSGDFEQSMANAAAVSGATGEEFERMKEIAKKMGSETVFAATDAADAMYYMASAGWDVNQMEKALKPTLDLAAATQTDLATTADSVVSSLNQFRLEAQDTARVTNVYAAAIGNSQATMEKLTNAMRYAGPMAGSLGYSIESTTAALMGLYDAGFKGEQAGTILRGALTKLLAPTYEAEEALANIGLTIEDVDPTTYSFAEIVGILGDAGLETAGSMAIFGQRAGPGMLSLLNVGAGALNDYEESITSTTSATEMAERMTETMWGTLKKLWSKIQDLAIQLGDILIPVMEDLMEGVLIPVINFFRGLGKDTQTLIIVLAALAAVLGPVLWITGSILTMLPGLIGGIGGLTGGVFGLSGAFATLNIAMGPVMWAIMGISLIAFTVIANWERVSKVVEDVADAIFGAFSWLADALGSIWDGITKGAETAFNLLTGIIKAPINAIIATINTLINAINSISFDIPDWVPLMGGMHVGFDLEPLQYLAEGGIVSSPRVAMIGEKEEEAVIPLSKLKSMDVGGASNYYDNREINIYDASETDIEKQLMKYNWATRGR